MGSKLFSVRPLIVALALFTTFKCAKATSSDSTVEDWAPVDNVNNEVPWGPIELGK